MTSTTSAENTVAAAINLPHTQLLIGGKWRDAESGDTFVTENPATAEPIARVARANAKDADLAVRAARLAFDSGPWPRMRAAERGQILHRLSTLVDQYREELITLESLDAGKPLRATARQDLPAAIDCLEYYAGWADKITGDVVPARPDALTYIVREPVGVVVGIVPWNFPLMNAVWKIAPALAAGCVVILKPAELTPLTALRLGELALEAGLPPGVLNVVPGFGTEAGAALVAHPDVDKVSFTGSPGVGRQIMRSAADSIKRIGLELGGKSPSIVFSDANLDSAAFGSASGGFFNAGQVCSAASRVLVHESIYEEFAARLVEQAQKISVGDPVDPSVRMGPVISAKQLDRVTGYIDVGTTEGAQVLTGGQRLNRPGHFVAPTLFGDVDPGTRIANEEIFGPVISLIRFTDDSDAVRIANGTPYSLAAALWSKDVTRCHRVAHQLRAGTVWVNTYGHTDTRLPWGGAGGDSGVGRDLGEAALANYTEAKTVWLDLNG